MGGNREWGNLLERIGCRREERNKEAVGKIYLRVKYNILAGNKSGKSGSKKILRAKNVSGGSTL